MENLTELKEEVTEDCIDDDLQLVKFIVAFPIDDYLEGKPILPLMDEIQESALSKLKQQRLKMSIGDIKSNRYHVHLIHPVG